MRHIDLNALLTLVFADAQGNICKKRLERAHKKLTHKTNPAARIKYTRKNGPNKWKPIKDGLLALLAKKCWYTEVELVGASLVIDHYRPVCEYWWLAYKPANYRVACPWANSAEHNGLYGCAGGKGDNFPLLPPGIRANAEHELGNERPIILDPCNPADCELLVFQVDGRPKLNPIYQGDAFAGHRVEQSKILLNIDHPDFNSKREQLCRAIAEKVRIHEALPANSTERKPIRTSLHEMIKPQAPFSAAAKFYLSLYRHLDWVEEILNPS